MKITVILPFNRVIWLSVKLEERLSLLEKMKQHLKGFLRDENKVLALKFKLELFKFLTCFQTLSILSLKSYIILAG